MFWISLEGKEYKSAGYGHRRASSAKRDTPGGDQLNADAALSQEHIPPGGITPNAHIWPPVWAAMTRARTTKTKPIR